MHKAVTFGATVLSALVLCAGMVWITYGIQRHERLPLLSLYTLSFLAYSILVYTTRTQKQVWWLLGVAVLCRLLLLPVLPNLSDDFYRFVWDGRLWNHGVNPFAYLPSDLIKSSLADSLPGIRQTLYQSLNSPDYFTIYPPVNQLIFAVATWIFPDSVAGSVLVIRTFILLTEVCNLWLLWMLLQQAKLPVRNVLIYALNPLVILELTSNLHFEGVALCFLLGSLYFLQKERWVVSAIFFAFAICTKLVPLIFLPLYLRRLGWRKALYFYTVTGMTTVLLFFPLLSRELIEGMRKSIGLYFQKFEFNASIYYLMREIGYYRKGYNVIETAGKQLAVSTFVLILAFAWLEKNRRLPAAFMWVLLIYLLLSTTVHPWYVIPLLAFSTFTPYRYAWVWSALIFFSYIGYTAGGYTENLVITAVEYGLVLGMLGYEWYHHRALASLRSR